MNIAGSTSPQLRRVTFTEPRKAALALAGMLATGLLLMWLFPWFSEQDSEYHFLSCRDAWHNARVFVDVWSRPLYTVFFAVPARLGWTFARLASVGVGVAIGWQTWKLAGELNLEKAWLVIPFLLGQPVFLLLYPDVLTEPLFALVLVVALRWHLLGRTVPGMILASLLPLARPEGFFICLLWGCWILERAWTTRETAGWPRFWLVIASGTFLLTGTFLWWLAALLISGDPLFIPHNWPHFWNEGMIPNATLFTYTRRSSEYLGVLLRPFFGWGLLSHFHRKGWREVSAVFLLPFVLHSIFQAYNLFGEAGFTRYMVSVAPAGALLTLTGWLEVTRRLRWSPRLLTVLEIGLIMGSLGISVYLMDRMAGGRDTVAIREMGAWLRAHPVPYQRVAWTNAAMCVELDRPGGEHPDLRGDNREYNLKTLREMPPGTLVFWDGYFGRHSLHLTPEEIQGAGYQLLRRHRYRLPPVLIPAWMGWRAEIRDIELGLLYKP